MKLELFANAMASPSVALWKSLWRNDYCTRIEDICRGYQYDATLYLLYTVRHFLWPGHRGDKLLAHKEPLFGERRTIEESAAGKFDFGTRTSKGGGGKERPNCMYDHFVLASVFRSTYQTTNTTVQYLVPTYRIGSHSRNNPFQRMSKINFHSYSMLC